MAWEQAGAAWGARAADWACLQESLLSNATDALLEQEQVGPGTVLVDVACGAGSLLLKARRRGAIVRGIDASDALLAIAAERVPDADLRRGDMADLPWSSGTVDLVTSVNGFMYGTDAAMTEAVRVLRPGGRLVMVFWERPDDYLGHFQIASACLPPAEDGAAVPVRLADPGVAEGMMEVAGLVPTARRSVPCVCEYPDIETAYRGLASSGVSWGAIDYSGERRFRDETVAMLEQYHSDRTGIVRMRAVFALLTGTKPDAD